MDSKEFMKAAILQAEKAAKNGEIPVGAVVVMDKYIVAEAGNRVMQDHDPTAHAEILALRKAGQALKNEKLLECDLYVTLEPCTMCAQAIAHARIRRVYFGAYDSKGGGVDHGAKVFSQKTCHHKPEVFGGIQELENEKLLKNFFQKKRLKNNSIDT